MHGASSGPAWLSDPWHLAVAATAGFVLLLCWLWLSRLFEEAWAAARRAPGGQLLLFLAGLILAAWAVHRFLAATPPDGTLARWGAA